MPKKCCYHQHDGAQQYDLNLEYDPYDLSPEELEANLRNHQEQIINEKHKYFNDEFNSKTRTSLGQDEPWTTSILDFDEALGTISDEMKTDVEIENEQAYARQKLLETQRKHKPNKRVKRLEQFISDLPQIKEALAMNATRPTSCIGGVPVDRESARLLLDRCAVTVGSLQNAIDTAEDPQVAIYELSVILVELEKAILPDPCTNQGRLFCEDCLGHFCCEECHDSHDPHRCHTLCRIADDIQFSTNHWTLPGQLQVLNRKCVVPLGGRCGCEQGFCNMVTESYTLLSKSMQVKEITIHYCDSCDDGFGALDSLGYFRLYGPRVYQSRTIPGWACAKKAVSWLSGPTNE